MRGRQTIWAAVVLPLVASGCTLLYQFEPADDPGSTGCGSCELCRCVVGDGHEPLTAVDARPDDGGECCSSIRGDFDGSFLEDWFFLDVQRDALLIVNPCSSSRDLFLEVRIYEDRWGTTEIDRASVNGANCAASLNHVVAADGVYSVRVIDVTGAPGEYTLYLTF